MSKSVCNVSLLVPDELTESKMQQFWLQLHLLCGRYEIQYRAFEIETPK